MNGDYFERPSDPNKRLSLREYVEYLLSLGKRSQDPEFQAIMRISQRYRQSIIAWAKEYLEKNKSDMIRK